jgi:hypothetical protein
MTLGPTLVTPASPSTPKGAAVPISMLSARALTVDRPKTKTKAQNVWNFIHPPHSTRNRCRRTATPIRSTMIVPELKRRCGRGPTPAATQQYKFVQFMGHVPVSRRLRVSRYVSARVNVKARIMTTPSCISLRTCSQECLQLRPYLGLRWMDLPFAQDRNARQIGRFLNRKCSKLNGICFWVG